MEAPPQTVQTLCRMCDDRCGIDVRVEDGCVLDISGNAAHPWNHGRLCVKARAAVDTVNHPDRLLRPLKRRGDDWEEIPLEQALDEIAERLRAIVERDGARSVSVWKGEAIGFAQQEDLARRFIHAIGSPNYLSNDSMCWVGRFTGYKLVLGAWPNVDIENARCVVMWGANPPHSRPNLTQRITAARRRGATLVAVDPRLSAVARRADLHVAPLPGTDGALALGLIRELVETGAYDRTFIERATLGFEDLAAYAREFTPEVVERETGVPAAVQAELARLLRAAGGRVALYPGNGLEHHENGVDNIRAILVAERAAGDAGQGRRLPLRPAAAAPRPHAVRRAPAHGTGPARRRSLPRALRRASRVSHDDGAERDPQRRALSVARHAARRRQPRAHQSELPQGRGGAVGARVAGGARPVPDRDGRARGLRPAGRLVPGAQRGPHPS